jgi:hypothetical protein
MLEWAEIVAGIEEQGNAYRSSVRKPHHHLQKQIRRRDENKVLLRVDTYETVKLTSCLVTQKVATLHTTHFHSTGSGNTALHTVR